MGRWAYGAAWLAADRSTARDLASARLAGAAGAATSAAIGAGRGDAERFLLVSALARLSEAIERGSGALAEAVERAVEEEAARLVDDGATLRALTARERTAFVPRFGLESFDAALRELGPDRHVLLREAAAQLEAGLMGTREPCPALRALRLYLQATLALDASEATVAVEAAPTSGVEPVRTLGIWLTAVLALAARRATAFAAAWASAARTSKDALSKTLAGLTSGAMLANNVVEALMEEPWALVHALAMTTEPEHAAAILDCGAQAQTRLRTQAAQSVAAWAAHADRAEELERRLGVAVLASNRDRKGHRDHRSAGSLDLFGAWNAQRAAETAQAALGAAMDRAMVAETARRREAVRQAKGALEGLRRAHEAALEAARAKLDSVPTGADVSPDDEGAQRGCVFGFGAGCSVMATYAAIGLVLGTGGVVGRVAPLVVGVAALPVGAAIFVQVAQGIRRAARANEATKRRASASEAFERARRATDSSHGSLLAEARGALEEAERELGEFVRHSAPDARAAA